MTLRRPPLKYVIPIVLAIALRVLLWWLMPADRFASDEDGYYRAGVSLATRGAQDTFWPPGVGWLIAGLVSAWPATGLKAVRFAWVLMDLISALLLGVIAGRVARPGVGERTPFPFRVALAYLCYLPAISFSQFATSETLAVLLILATVACVMGANASIPRLAIGGILTGLVVLTRPSLAGLLVTLPMALALTGSTVTRTARTLGVSLFIVAAGAIVGAWLWRNERVEGGLFLSTNSAYNFSIGNQDVYQEDLNLFSPAATPEQIAFRRQLRSGQPMPEVTVDPPQRTLENIRRHKTLFLRRATGRLARLFVPRTDELELVGGGRRTRIFWGPAMGLFFLANLQWSVVLLGGLAGLLTLWRTQRSFAVWCIAVMFGAIPLCLVAISKPRYGFVFEPLLLVSAIGFLESPRDDWRLLTRGAKTTFFGLVLFFAWAWAAWLTFAFTSRV
jgi:hypothetical protein